jgi:hypothetical protein
VNAPVLFLEVLFTPFEVTTTSAGLFAAAGRLPWWEIATGILTIPAGVATLIYTLVQIRKVWIETGVQKEKIENRVHEREVEPGREGSVDNGMIGKPGSHPPKSALPEGKMDIAELGRDRFLRGGTNGFFAHFEPGVVASCHSPNGRLPPFGREAITKRRRGFSITRRDLQALATFSPMMTVIPIPAEGF